MKKSTPHHCVETKTERHTEREKKRERERDLCVNIWRHYRDPSVYSEEVIK